MIRRRQIAKLLSWRRLTAAVLLLLLVGDIAWHIGESYFEDQSASSNEPLITASQAFHYDESNCPIPGHSDAGRFHHHHYPGVIISHSIVAPVSLQRIIVSTHTELTGSATLVAHPSRAPPVL